MSLTKQAFFLFGISLLTLLPKGAAAATDSIHNVKFEVTGQEIVVTYDLTGEGDFMVSLLLLREYGKPVVPIGVSGDVGTLIREGKGRMIVWDVLRDFPTGLVGDEFVLEVRATRKRHRRKWLWIGGMGLAAGAAVVVVDAQGESTGTIVIDIPDPEGS